MAQHLILVINPGSTSTKVAVYRDEEQLHERTLRHSTEELAPFKTIYDQHEFRKGIILGFLEEVGIAPKDLSAVVGRGGLFQPVISGTYAVNDEMLQDGREGYLGQHASNLGCGLAYGIAQDAGGVPSFISDPPCVDEYPPLARLSGHKMLPRVSMLHCLNIKAMARRAAAELNKPLAETRLIIAHLGGGNSIAALEGGRVVEVNNALYGGPFSPERAGDVPVFPLIDWVYEEANKGTPKRKLKKTLTGGGGLVSYMNTNSAKEVEDKALAGDRTALYYYKGMAYQISYYIGGAAAVLRGEVDRIIITGGLAYGKEFVEWIEEWTGWIAPVVAYPGEDELGALAGAALRVLRGEEEPLTYPTRVREDEEF